PRRRGASMTTSFRLGRWAGIPVGAHWSVLLTIGFIAQATALLVLPSSAPGYPTWAYWTAGVAIAVIFLVALLTHELAHAYVARRAGIRVDRITLWLLGGATAIEDQGPTPGVELRVALAGPQVSLTAGGVFVLAAFAASWAGWPTLVVAGLAWLGSVNLVLAVFNLLPAAPLDGGRVLHALVWRWTGSRDRATGTAGTAGIVLGALILVLGLVEFVAGGPVTGLWLAALGWCLSITAGRERAGDRLRTRLAGVTVRDVMSSATVAPSWLTIDAFVERIGRHAGQRTFPVVEFTGRPSGVVTLADLARVPVQSRMATRIADVQRHPARMSVVAPETPLLTVLASNGVPRGMSLILVAEHDRLVGVVSATDIAAALELAALDQAPEHLPPHRAA
ncbi:MAG TPA: site-2 protease family protein, partial [Nakamurella sp.]